MLAQGWSFIFFQLYVAMLDIPLALGLRAHLQSYNRCSFSSNSLPQMFEPFHRLFSQATASVPNDGKNETVIIP